MRRLVRLSHIFSSTVREVLDGELVRQACPEPLTLVQFRLLKLIAQNGDPQVGQVATSMGVSAAAACKNLDTLERHGLIARGSSPTDRRATILSASSKGYGVVRAYEQLTEERVATIVSALGPERVSQLCELLEGISVNLMGDGTGAEDACLRCAGYYDDHCHLRTEDVNCPSNLSGSSSGGMTP